MNIFIKSFNRPNYLERCILSIHNNVVGFDKIYVPDIGIDETLLKQKKKVPCIISARPQNYLHKSQNCKIFISVRETIQLSKLVVEFWLTNFLKKGAKYLYEFSPRYCYEKLDIFTSNFRSTATNMFPSS